MVHLFISYNNEDVAVVRTLAADLASLSHQVWFDKELTGGQAWWDLILAEIRRCDVFVFALSPASLESYPCRLEREYASALGKPILPVLAADGVSASLLPPALSKVQFVDYRRHDKSELVAVIRALDTLPPPQPPEVPPEPPPVPISYLSELKDQIDTPATLGFEAQTVLVFKLKEAIRQQADARDGRRLLELLRKRRDLFAVVAAEIDEALADRKTAIAKERVTPRAVAPPALLVAAKPDEPEPPPPRQAVPAARTIDVDNDLDAVIDVLRRVVQSHEAWTLTATPYRSISVTCEGQTMTAVALFSDLAEIIGSAGTKLKAEGWQKDIIKTAGQMLAGVAVGLSFGALLLNRTVRDSSVANTVSRSWTVRSGETRQLRPIAKDIVDALRIIAPKHKKVTAAQVK
jgi:hypothetical protein